MDEAKAHAYYNELLQKGSGAAKFKRGLGFSGEDDIGIREAEKDREEQQAYTELRVDNIREKLKKRVSSNRESGSKSYSKINSSQNTELSISLADEIHIKQKKKLLRDQSIPNAGDQGFRSDHGGFRSRSNTCEESDKNRDDGNYEKTEDDVVQVFTATGTKERSPEADRRSSSEEREREDERRELEREKKRKKQQELKEGLKGGRCGGGRKDGKERGRSESLVEMEAIKGRARSRSVERDRDDCQTRRGYRRRENGSSPSLTANESRSPSRSPKRRRTRGRARERLKRKRSKSLSRERRSSSRDSQRMGQKRGRNLSQIRSQRRDQSRSSRRSRSESIDRRDKGRDKGGKRLSRGITSSRSRSGSSGREDRRKRQRSRSRSRERGAGRDRQMRRSSRRSVDTDRGRDQNRDRDRSSSVDRRRQNRERRERRSRSVDYRDRRERSRSRDSGRTRRRSRGRGRRRSSSREKRRGRSHNKEQFTSVLNKGPDRDYSKLIPGYDDMTPSERIKAKMRLQLSETVVRDSKQSAGTEWERFDFHRDAPLDDDAKQDYFGDGTGTKDDTSHLRNAGTTFVSSQGQAIREAQLAAAHEAAIFGASLPPDLPNPKSNCLDSTPKPGIPNSKHDCNEGTHDRSQSEARIPREGESVSRSRLSKSDGRRGREGGVAKTLDRRREVEGQGSVQEFPVHEKATAGSVNAVQTLCRTGSGGNNGDVAGGKASGGNNRDSAAVGNGSDENSGGVVVGKAVGVLGWVEEEEEEEDRPVVLDVQEETKSPGGESGPIGREELPAPSVLSAQIVSMQKGTSWQERARKMREARAAAGAGGQLAS